MIHLMRVCIYLQKEDVGGFFFSSKLHRTMFANFEFSTLKIQLLEVYGKFSYSGVNMFAGIDGL